LEQFRRHGEGLIAADGHAPGARQDGPYFEEMRDIPAAIRARALVLLAQLSDAEKLALLDGDTPFWSGMADIALADASHSHPWPADQLPRLGLAGLQFVDGPRGVVLKGGATTFPVPIARGASWNPELEQRIGEAIALEARSFGANWVAAVCVNLLRHPGWGRAQETYGEDPVHVGAMGAACTRGLQRHTIACVKHFALNSIDSCRFLVDVQVDKRVLHELYLPHFRDCVEAGAGSVMSAYNRVNGSWCGEHAELLNSILKRRWGFNGFVVSDFIFGIHDGVAAVLAGQDLEMPFEMVFAGCLAEALAAGRLPQGRLDDAVLRLLQAQLAVPAGTYPATLRSCPAHRALAREAATQSIVLLRNEPPRIGPQPNPLLPDQQLAVQQLAAQQIAAREPTGQQIAARDPVLPFRDLTSLALIGRLAAVPNLGDRGSSDTRPSAEGVVTPLEGLRQADPELRIDYHNGEDPQAAAALAARSQAAVVVVGLDWRLEGEHIHPGDIGPILELMPPPQWLLQTLGPRTLLPLWKPVAQLVARITSQASARQGGDFAAGDRTDLRLPAEQVALIRQVAAANPRTVVVLMGGGALLSQEWHDAVPGLLLLWYPGQEGGHALADVLLGRVSPSGRLPFSLPSTTDQLPPFEPRARRIVYDLWHGYRRLGRDGQAAAFPFGYGLSYSQFVTTTLSATLMAGSDTSSKNGSDTSSDNAEPAISLAVTVANSGAMEAAEVLQIYLEPPGLAVQRPARTLVAFARVPLAAGSSQRITLTTPLHRLAFFDVHQDGFQIEAGIHRLVLARHCEDPGLVCELALDATFLGR
jgi:beta-glucosidase